MIVGGGSAGSALANRLSADPEHTVLRELGLDRHPELRDEYFGHYKRVLWLAQRHALVS